MNELMEALREWVEAKIEYEIENHLNLYHSGGSCSNKIRHRMEDAEYKVRDVLTKVEEKWNALYVEEGN